MAKPGPLNFMEEVWREATARFKSRTGKDIDVKPPRTFDDCVNSMERNQALAKSEEKSSTEKGKQYGIAILKCVKLLGGMATTGAEWARFWFSGESLLLNIPERLRDFRMQIDDLFGVIEPSPSVFKIYHTMEQFDELEDGLKEAINKVMISLVDIYTLYIELTNAGMWKSFKNKVKVAILEENGIKEEIDQLQKLTGGHQSIQSTQTLNCIGDQKRARKLVD
ncbi:nacht and tpr domain containing protein [Fusarium austroafricanum]|uniref:Nacht and tpr domain containing protein n=1 Tax=Fusarium austroafricanum TaxID=2364996 RepID=A0A8H4JTJ4_9HYPO|nr:nacht and tpr domain containing protein [Fusarium austroafricanum]